MRSQLKTIPQVYQIETDIVAQTARLRFAKNFDIEAALDEAAESCDKLEGWKLVD